MKKITILLMDDFGNYYERIMFTDNSPKYIKNMGIQGFVKIAKTERIKHPSPEILFEALEEMGIDTQEFYSLCDTKQTIANDMKGA